MTSKIVKFREVLTTSLLSKQEDLYYSIHLFGAQWGTMKAVIWNLAAEVGAGSTAKQVRWKERGY